MLDRLHDRAPLGRSLKCALHAGTLDGEPVVAKVLEHRDPVWRWYFEREVRILPRLAAAGAPRLIDADLDAGVMILERLPGSLLARGRRVSPEIDPLIIDAILAIADRAAAIDLSDLEVAPEPAVRAAMRRRLLEDPSAPIDWFVDGVARCASLGLIDGRSAARMTAALDGVAAVCQHGDLLPRNVLVGGAKVFVIDWECAGPHARDWDRALLWAGLPATGRSHIEASVGADPGRIAAFRGLCAFALAREVKFARAGSPGRSRLERDLAASTARLDV